MIPTKEKWLQPSSLRARDALANASGKTFGAGNVGSDVRSGGGDGEPAVERAGGGTGAMRGGGDVHRLGKPQCSLPAGLDNLNFDDRDEGR